MPRPAITAAAIAAALIVAACHRAPPPPPKPPADAALTGSLADQIVVDPAFGAPKPGGHPFAVHDTPPVQSATPATKPVASAAVPAAKPPAPIAKPAPKAAVATAATPPAPRCIGKDCRPATVTLAQLAKDQRAPHPAPPVAAGKTCNPTLRYGAGWAAKLPPELPVYPGGHVDDQAGSDEPRCSIRVVSFTAAAPWQTVRDWYRDRLAKAGWTAEATVRDGDPVLAGTRASGGAYYLSFAEHGRGGSAINMVVSADR